jgi:hypothetical protein
MVKMHKCTYDETEVPHGGYGPAVFYCIEEDGIFHIGGDEYDSSVNYCPFCGEKAPVQSVAPKEEGM